MGGGVTDSPLHSFQAKVRTQTWGLPRPHPAFEVMAKLLSPTSVPWFPYFFIGPQLIYNVILISVVQQGESVIHIHISTLGFFSHKGHYGVLSQVACAIQQVLISGLFYRPI